MVDCGHFKRFDALFLSPFDPIMTWPDKFHLDLSQPQPKNAVFFKKNGSAANRPPGSI
jgi:hypothetical protein